MLLFLCLIVYFSTSFPLIWPVECLLFWHSLFEFSTSLYFSFPSKAFMLLILCLSAHFVIISLQFDLLNVSSSATHTAKFNRSILFISKWSPHDVISTSLQNFYFFPLFWPVECLLFCHSQFEFSTGRYLSYPNEALMLPFLCLIAYFSTSFPLIWPVEFLLFCHSLFTVSTGH